MYGAPLPFSFQCESRFDWGHIQLQLDAKNGVITGVKVYSDSMDWMLPETVEKALAGCRFDTVKMQEALKQAITDQAVYQNLCQMLAEQTL